LKRVMNSLVYLLEKTRQPPFHNARKTFMLAWERFIHAKRVFHLHLRQYSLLITTAYF